jgi:hypothetical protein
MGGGCSACLAWAKPWIPFPELQQQQQQKTYIKELSPMFSFRRFQSILT